MFFPILDRSEILNKFGKPFYPVVSKMAKRPLEIKDGKPVVYAKSRTEWRNWLNKNSAKERSVWLILYHKKSEVPCVNLNDATEEALCFGWIDSLAKGRDEESSYLTFTPRNPKTNKWSASNRERAERLIKAGLMTEQGQKLIDLAKEKGTWHIK
jgi:uncharacterized protein YdeI (YjbR/CyaY-like superfamily)